MGMFDWILSRRKTDFRLPWENRYRVGIGEIDRQHETLFDMYNGLVEAIWRGESLEVLGAVLDDLLKYVAVHFATEEKYMEKYGYPEFPEHQEAHRELMNRTYTLHKDFSAGKHVLSEDVLHFLRNWISNHILIKDHRYKSFLKRHISSAGA